MFQRLDIFRKILFKTLRSLCKLHSIPFYSNEMLCRPLWLQACFGVCNKHRAGSHHRESPFYFCPSICVTYNETGSNPKFETRASVRQCVVPIISSDDSWFGREMGGWPVGF